MKDLANEFNGIIGSAPFNVTDTSFEIRLDGRRFLVSEQKGPHNETFFDIEGTHGIAGTVRPDNKTYYQMAFALVEKARLWLADSKYESEEREFHLREKVAARLSGIIGEDMAWCPEDRCYKLRFVQGTLNVYVENDHDSDLIDNRRYRVEIQPLYDSGLRAIADTLRGVRGR